MAASPAGLSTPLLASGTHKDGIGSDKKTQDGAPVHSAKSALSTGKPGAVDVGPGQARLCVRGEGQGGGQPGAEPTTMGDPGSTSPRLSTVEASFLSTVGVSWGTDRPAGALRERALRGGAVLHQISVGSFHNDRTSLGIASTLNIMTTITIRMTFPLSLLVVLLMFLTYRSKLPDYRNPNIGFWSQFYRYIVRQGYISDHPWKPAAVYASILAACTWHEEKQKPYVFWEAFLPLALLICSQIATAVEFEPHTPEQIELWLKRHKLGARWLARALRLPDEMIKDIERTEPQEIEPILGKIKVPCMEVCLVRAGLALSRPYPPVLLPMIFCIAWIWNLGEDLLKPSSKSALLGTLIAGSLMWCVLFVARCLSAQQVLRRYESWTEDAREHPGFLHRCLQDWCPLEGLPLSEVLWELSDCNTRKLGDSLGLSFDWIVHSDLYQVARGRCCKRAEMTQRRLNEVWAAAALFNLIPHDNAFFRREELASALGVRFSLDASGDRELRAEFLLPEYRKGWENKSVDAGVLIKQLLLGVDPPVLGIEKCCTCFWSPGLSILKILVIVVAIVALAMAPGCAKATNDGNLTACLLTPGTDRYIDFVWLYMTWPCLLGILRRFAAFKQLALKSLNANLNLNKMLMGSKAASRFGWPCVNGGSTWGIITWLQARELVQAAYSRRMKAYELMLGWIVIVYVFVFILGAAHFFRYAYVDKKQKPELRHRFFSSIVLIAAFSASFLLLTLCFFAPVLYVGVQLNRALKKQVRYLRGFGEEIAVCIGYSHEGVKIVHDGTVEPVPPEELANTREICRTAADRLESMGGPRFTVLGITMKTRTLVMLATAWAGSSVALFHKVNVMLNYAFGESVDLNQLVR